MQRNTRFLAPVLVIATVLGAVVLSPTTPAEAASARVERQLDNPVDRDGDGELGEAEAIRARVREYLERHGDHGELSPQSNLAKARWAYGRFLASREQLSTKGISGNGWVSLGPNNGAGRFTAIAPHPTAMGTVLAGAAGGGVWRTTDGGATWAPLTDGIPDLSVGAVAYAPSDPDVVYLGSGEGGYAIDFISGIGLLRSEDGGETWILPDTVVASNFYRISVDPRDPDTLVCATNAGLLRSTDGGVTWTAPIPRTSGGGASVTAVTDVVRSASNPDRLYAALWCRTACPAGTDRVMTSTDNGVTWTAAGAGLPAPADDWDRNRLGLALSPVDDSVLFAATNITGDDQGSPPARVYSTANGGQQWQEAKDPNAYLGAQGWYDNTITISPSGSGTVIAGGVWYIRSTNGGNSWSDQNPYNRAGLPHVDAHDLQWQGQTLWLANDGGIWKSGDEGSTWTDCNSGLITRQYYGIAIDSVNRQRVLGGAQDNGTNRRRDIGDNSWDAVLGGDGFECAINPLVPSITYATIYNTSVYRSTQGGAPNSFAFASPYFGNDENAPFITPLTMRPDSPWVLYTGTDRVWRTTDAADSWRALPTTVVNGSWNDSEIWRVAVTAADSDVLMVAKGPSIYRSEDGGVTWRVSPQGVGGLPGKRVINVEISPSDPYIALACLAGTTGGHLYRTTDGGLTWTQSDTGLPSFPVQVARWDPTDAATVYAGTDVGLYRSTDGGVTWQEFGQGLPAASVHDVRILPDGSMLRVATHGRGVWELDIPHEANTPPQVAITSPTGTLSLTAGDAADFSASASDADGDRIAATWVFTDDWTPTSGGSSTGALFTTVNHTFEVGGHYLAAASVEDDHGGRASTTVSVDVDDPANQCLSPRVVPANGPFPYELQLSNATASRGAGDPSPPCVSDPSDDKAGTWGSMWFEFTPTTSMRYAISTCGSGADTVLSLWNGAECGPYTAVPDGCNDDDENVHCDGGRTDSYVEADLQAGTTYRIMVASYAINSRGRFNLQVACADCAPPTIAHLYLVPAAAHTAGVGDTNWVTDLSLTNPGTAPVTAELAFLPAGGSNAEADTVTVTVSAGGSQELTDVVASTLEAQGSGAIRVEADGKLLVASRTYNTAASGTYGQFIPGVDGGTGVAPGQVALLAGLERDSSFRTNIGLVNDGNSAASATVELYAADGTLLGQRTISLAPWGWRQITDIYGSVGVSDLGLGYALVRNTSTDYTIHPYASVVDARTGDPTYVTEGPVALPGAPLWIAASAHSSGVNDSVWRTDVVFANPGTAAGWPATDALVTLEYYRTGGGAPLSYSAVVPTGGAIRLDDVVATAFGTSGAGAIRVTVTQGRVAAISRTYNVAASGTYGQFIPGAPQADALGDGDNGVLLQLRRTAAFRTNVGIVNLAADELKVRVDFNRADGSLLGTRHYTVPAHAYFQHTNAMPGSDDVSGATATVTAESTGSTYLAYASVVDNGSGDPVFVPAVLGDN